MKTIPALRSARPPAPFAWCPPALAAASLLAGCATKPVLLPPDEDLRSRLGPVCIVTDCNVARIRFQVPDSKADLLAEKQCSDPADYRDATKGIFQAMPDPRAAPIALAAATVVVGGAPLWQEIRRAVGVVVADTEQSVDSARTAMGAAVAEVRFEDQLGARLTAEISRAAPAQPLVATPRHADTILELMAYEPAITGREGINPGLALRLGLRIRLLDAHTRRELYYDYLDYQGSKHTLVEWADADARLFHAELARCLEHLSREVVAQLFVRPPDEATNRSTLAALGISRRPAQLLSAGPASLPTPAIYNPRPYVYARR